MSVTSLDQASGQDRRPLDDALTVLAVFLLLSSSFLFFNDRVIYDWLYSNGDRTVIARVNPASHDVRRKVVDDFSWLPLRDVEDIYDYDSVFTSQDSVAYLTFYDNSKVLLGPNSLVVLHFDQNGPSIIVKRGTASLAVAPTKKVRVQVDGQLQEVTSQTQVARFESKTHPSTVDVTLESEKLTIAGPVRMTASQAPVSLATQPLPSIEPLARLTRKDEAVPFTQQKVPHHKPHPRQLAAASPVVTEDAPQMVADAPPPTYVAPARVDYYPPAEPLKTPVPDVKNKHLELTGVVSYLFGNSASVFGEGNAQGFINRFGLSTHFSTTIIGGSGPSTQSGVINPGTTVTRFNADLKYQLLAGEWDKSTLAGISAGYQSAALAGVSAGMMGVGGFFGKQLEGDFNNLLNKVGFLNYPKWVEANLQYYFLPGTSGTTLGTNINFSVSGKLFVRPSFFMFTSLGYFQNGFTNSAQGVQANVSAAYGSGGIGFLF